MFISLLSKEIRNHLLTFRFAAALVTTMLLVIVSLWVLGDDYVHRRDAYNLAAEDTERQNYEVYVPSQISPILHRPPATLSIFAQGEDRRFGNSLQVRRWEVPRRAEGSFTDNMFMSAHQALDLNTIIAIVLSLFGILLSYDAVSGEREKGTLKLQCVMGASRASIYLAMLLGAVVCLALPLIISLAGGLLMLSVFFGISFSATQWWAIIAMTSAGLLYGALFVALGSACSSLVRRSSVSLVLSLLLWVLSVLVVPVAAQGSAGLLVPLPSSSEVSNYERATEREATEKMGAFADEHPRYSSGWNSSYYSVTGSGSYYKYDGKSQWFRDAEAFVRFVEPMMLARAGRVWDLYNSQDRMRARQASLVMLLSFPSPAHHLREALTALSITSYGSYSGFLESARAYRRQMIADFQNRDYFAGRALQFFSRRTPEETTDEGFSHRYQHYRQELDAGKRYEEIIGLDKWGKLPREDILPFDFDNGDPDFATAFQPIGVLAAMLAIAVIAGFTAFIRYDVR